MHACPAAASTTRGYLSFLPGKIGVIAARNGLFCDFCWLRGFFAGAEKIGLASKRKGRILFGCGPLSARGRGVCAAYCSAMSFEAVTSVLVPKGLVEGLVLASELRMSVPRFSTPEDTTAITARPRPTSAAVRTTQSTVTAPDSDLAKFLISAVVVQLSRFAFCVCPAGIVRLG